MRVAGERSAFHLCGHLLRRGACDNGFRRQRPHQCVGPLNSAPIAAGPIACSPARLPICKTIGNTKKNVNACRPLCCRRIAAWTTTRLLPVVQSTEREGDAASLGSRRFAVAVLETTITCFAPVARARTNLRCDLFHFRDGRTGGTRGGDKRRAGHQGRLERVSGANSRSTQLGCARRVLCRDYKPGAFWTLLNSEP